MEQQKQIEEVEMGRSLAYTPTWSIAAVTTILVGLGFLAQRLIHDFGNWLLKTKRRALLDALEKIKEELMVFGLISLLLGQWAEWVSKICSRSSVFSSQFYMCSIEGYGGNERRRLLTDAGVQFSNNSFSESWRTKRPLVQRSSCPVKHNLPLTYNFHNYLSRNMEDEFRDLVGLSWLLWAYAILCIFLNFHGTNVYFWLSFIPAILILLVGTKLHHIVVQLALERVTSDREPVEMQARPRDELFWLGKPKLLLWLIQFISFQNAFEMATFIWSLWEIKSSRCFMRDSVFLVTRLSSGVLVQFWCSYGVLPHYVIIAQMGSKFKKALISENVRESLRGWLQRVQRKTRKHHSEARFGAVKSTSFKTVVEEIHADNSIHPTEVTSPNANEFSLQENDKSRSR